MVVIAFTLGFVDAQVKAEMVFGVKGGFNISTITNADVDGVNSKSLVGFHVGFFGEFKISNTFAIQPEVMFSLQWTEIEFEMLDGNLKLDYITILVMAKYYVADAFSMEFGHQIDILVSAKSKSSGESEVVKDSLNLQM